MESVGKCLKVERELRNLSLEEATKFTKIREHFLRAIEEDRYELLPPAVYVKGFLTVYARYLGLDPKDVVLRYQNYLKSLSIPKPLEGTQQILPPKERGGPSPLFVGIFGIILFIALFVYFISNELPSIPPPTQLQEKVRTPATNQAQKRETLRPKEVEAKEAIAPEVFSFEVLEASMGTRIEQESGRIILTGKSSEFTCNNQRAYFFTRIKAQREGNITHVWLCKGKEFHRIEIEVKPPSWSVYSYITLRPQHAGNWKAEVRDGDKVLISLSFKVSVPLSV